MSDISKRWTRLSRSALAVAAVAPALAVVPFLVSSAPDPAEAAASSGVKCTELTGKVDGTSKLSGCLPKATPNATVGPLTGTTDTITFSGKQTVVMGYSRTPVNLAGCPRPKLSCSDISGLVTKSTVPGISAGFKVSATLKENTKNSAVSLYPGTAWVMVK